MRGLGWEAWVSPRLRGAGLGGPLGCRRRMLCGTSFLFLYFFWKENLGILLFFQKEGEKGRERRKVVYAGLVGFVDLCIWRMEGERGESWGIMGIY